MPCKTKSRQTSRGSVRTVHAMPPDTPRPPIFYLKLSKNRFLWKSRFSSFSAVFAVFWPLSFYPHKCSSENMSLPRRRSTQITANRSTEIVRSIWKIWKLMGYARRFVLVKHENRPPPCHVRPNPTKVRGNRFAQSMPCPRTPPRPPTFNLKLSKNRFLWKSRFFSFSVVFAVCLLYRTSFFAL